MGNGYTKLFADIVDSSIWEEPPETCKVWVTLLALSDADGFVRGSVGWLAGKSRVSAEQCQKAIDQFQKPDERSRTPDHEGRRVEILPDGFLILNYLAFRDRLSNDPIAKATRDRVRKHRERYKVLRNAESVTSDDSVYASEDASDSESLKGGCKGETSKRGKLIAFGEFGKVKLSQSEHVKLIEKHGPEKTNAGITELDAWLESTGKRRKNHYACLSDASWVWEKIGNTKGQQNANQPPIHRGMQEDIEIPILNG